MSHDTIKSTLDRFLERGVVIRNYSPYTVASYRNTWKLFLQITKIVYIRDLDNRNIEEYMFHGRVKRNWSTVTYHTHLKNINSFLKWCVKEGIIEVNPAQQIEKPRLEKRLPKKLSRDNAEYLLNLTLELNYYSEHERFRNHAIIASMLLAGLRISEVINLQCTDVDLIARELNIQQGKGKKDRVIPICNRLYLIFLAYLDNKKKENRISRQFFTGVNEQRRFSKKGVQRLVARLRNETGIYFSAHTLRHSFATLMLEGGCDIYTLSNLMGHSKISTTVIYLQCNSSHKKRSIQMHSLNT